MDFELNDEQRQLKDSVERVLSREYGFERRRRIVASDEGTDRALWRQFAELGWLGLPFAECDGGLGGGAVETMVVSEAFGRALVVEPWLASVVLAASVLRDAASPAQRDAWLPALIGGECIATLAHAEPASRHDRHIVSTRALDTADGFRLNGRKSLVPHGQVADLLLVCARSSGADDSPQGLSLFAVPRDTPGLFVDGYVTQDGQRAADLELVDVDVPRNALVGKPGGAYPHLSHALDRGIAALCAQAVGTMQTLYEATLEHLKTRRQFGVAIGKFQALQHRMAEMLMALEHARSMLLLATAHADLDDAPRRERVLSAAKAAIGQAARSVGQQAVQLHGGMGVTDELIVSHAFKSLTVFNLTLGDSDHHLARVGDAIRAEALGT